MKKKVHSVILARGGSKGIKNKNLCLLNSKPLIYWSIKKSLESNLINKTWVSSDSKEILDYSKSVGANIIERPSKFATDRSSSEVAWLHASRKLQNDAEIIVGIQPTSPIRDGRDFDNALRKFYQYKYHHYLYKNINHQMQFQNPYLKHELVHYLFHLQNILLIFYTYL